MQRVDAIIADNPGVSLDDLVASKKINADQKASALKKPQLQAQLRQLEEQVAQYKKFDQEYQEKIAQEKQILQQSHTEEMEKLRETLKAEAVLEAQKTFRENFLTLSRFLRAAARRQMEEDDSDLSKAFEGALLLVYGGDASAVTAAEKLISGSSDNVPSTEGVTLSVTCTFDQKYLFRQVLEC
jgi:ribosomal protein L16 Arg81 hydroxylase